MMKNPQFCLPLDLLKGIRNKPFFFSDLRKRRKKGLPEKKERQKKNLIENYITHYTLCIPKLPIDACQNLPPRAMDTPSVANLLKTTTCSGNIEINSTVSSISPLRISVSHQVVGEKLFLPLTEKKTSDPSGSNCKIEQKSEGLCRISL